MVLRSEGKEFNSFVGTVKDVQFESRAPTATMEATKQFHISIDAEGFEVKGKTGLLHEWIRYSPKTKDDEVPQGSIIARYLDFIESALPEAKKSRTLNEAFSLLRGRKFEWKKMKMGKAYQGHDAREYWVPVSLKA